MAWLRSVENQWQSKPIFLFEDNPSAHVFLQPQQRNQWQIQIQNWNFVASPRRGFQILALVSRAWGWYIFTWWQYKVKPNLMQTSGMRSHSAGTRPSLKVPPTHHLTAVTNSWGLPACMPKKWSPFSKIFVIHIIWVSELESLEIFPKSWRRLIAIRCWRITVCWVPTDERSCKHLVVSVEKALNDKIFFANPLTQWQMLKHSR